MNLQNRLSESSTTAPRGVLMEDLTWLEAEAILCEDRVLVIPLGASTKEHGPHLRLNNDFVLAEYFKMQILQQAPVIVAPTVNYSFYPSFVDYPGSVSLEKETAANLILDICRSFKRGGAKRIYVLNTGISTMRILAPAAEVLNQEGLLVRYTNWGEALRPVVQEIGQQEGGSHADEIETSMMLYIAPDRVDMSKAVKDYDADGVGKLSRIRQEGTTYSPTGIWGDATLANVVKGERIVKSLINRILEDIDKLSALALPGSS